MLSFLKNHPFAVEAFFESSVVLTFAVPKEQLQPLIPECLQLDTYKDKWAFLAMAMVQTRHLRPKGFPEMFGHHFFLVGYRLFVQYHTNAGKRLRGLYILKSETNKKKMELMGNIFTHYNYATTDINLATDGQQTTIHSAQSGFNITIEDTGDAVDLPSGSPFTDWKDARRFAGPLPFTFTYDQPSKTVLIIEGVRTNWTPRPVKIVDYHISFPDSLHLTNVAPANAFIINNIPYHWKKGIKEKWNC